MKSENLQFSDLAPHKNGEQPRCRASSGTCGTASHTLHRTTIQQRFANPCCLLVRFFAVGLSASYSCPIHSGVLAFLGALLSWRHFTGKLYWLAADDSVVKEHWFSILELEKARFARYFQNLYRFFAVSQIGIRKGSFIYNFLKFSKFHSPTRREHCGCEMNFHQANHQKRTVLYEGMGSRIPIKMPGMKSPNGILSYSGQILP